MFIMQQRRAGGVTAYAVQSADSESKVLEDHEIRGMQQRAYSADVALDRLSECTFTADRYGMQV